MNEEDARLVKAAQSGEREAFDRLVERYQRQAVAVALRFVSNVDDALEVAQEVFVRAYQALGQLQDPTRFGPWLMRIVTNQALNFRRQRSRHVALSLTESSGQDDDGGADLEDQLAGHEPTAQEQITGHELAEEMQKALAELPENLRQTLLLFTVDNLPQKEIAEILTKEQSRPHG